MKLTILLFTFFLLIMSALDTSAQTPGRRVVKHSNNQNKKQANSINVKRTSYSKSGNDFVFNVRGAIFKMKYVEGGTFTMGATSEQLNDAYDDEEPAHKVTLSNFYIGETEVTQFLWKMVMGNNPSRFKDDNRPVECVSWYDCQTFIHKLNSITGRNFRLPTEAEWEYAARGGKKSRNYKYSGSNNINTIAWYFQNAFDIYKEDRNKDYGSHPVKTKLPNELNLYDMSGNVSEWCRDCKGIYNTDHQINPLYQSNCTSHIYRGGYWKYGDRGCRVSTRFACPADERLDYMGFRIVMSE